MSSNPANFQLFSFRTPQLVAQDRAILLKLTPHRQERLGERIHLELEQNVPCGCNALTEEPETALQAGLRTPHWDGEISSSCRQPGAALVSFAWVLLDR